jgi:hypothetical protein
MRQSKARLEEMADHSSRFQQKLAVRAEAIRRQRRLNPEATHAQIAKLVGCDSRAVAKVVAGE